MRDRVLALIRGAERVAVHIGGHLAQVIDDVRRRSPPGRVRPVSGVPLVDALSAKTEARKVESGSGIGLQFHRHLAVLPAAR